MSMEQLQSGALYEPNDTTIMELQGKCLEKLYDYNATRPSQGEKRWAIPAGCCGVWETMTGNSILRTAGSIRLC